MLKKILIIVLFAAVSLVAGYYIYDDPRPVSSQIEGAEALVDRMHAAINIEAWERIPIIAWASHGGHHYIWDKHFHVSQVNWPDHQVVINLNTRSGEAFKSGTLLTGAEAEKAIEKAWALWCNDSFWLNAPAKARDAGTKRTVVTNGDGTESLLIEYGSGGVTPGDSYLWTLDENGIPASFKMWVSIIPIGGVEATWTEWVDLDGTLIATLRKVGPVPIKIENLRSGTSPADFGLAPDYFSRWVKD